MSTCQHVPSRKRLPTCPLTLLFLKQPPPLNPTPPQQPQPFRVPGKAEGQADDNQRQARREGQGNSDQSRDDQNRSRDHPGRLDNTEHIFKVTNSCSAQVAPIGYLTISSKGNRRPGLMLRSYAPQLIIRSPYAAPFEFWLSPCPHVNMPTCPLSRFTRVPFYRNKSPCVPVRTSFKSSFVVA